MTEATSAQARPKLLLVSSSGGHLKHLTATAAAWQDYDRVWVSFKQPDVESSLADEKTYWAYYPTTRNIKNAMASPPWRSSWTASSVGAHPRGYSLYGAGLGDSGLSSPDRSSHFCFSLCGVLGEYL